MKQADSPQFSFQAVLQYMQYSGDNLNDTWAPALSETQQAT